MIKKIKLILMIIFILIVLFINITNVQAIENKEYTLVENIDYNETLDNIKNPERGFYSTAFLKLSPSNNKATNSGANLVHLRVDIGDFSGAVNGTGDLEFTDDALNALSKTFENIKSNGGSVIIRFAYDGFNGRGDLEPSLDMLLKHISQLKPVFEKNQDVISYVELGFFGPWGEMHTSKICNTNNVSKAIDVMLDAVPSNIKIGVRTPNYYAKWLGVDNKNLGDIVTEKGTDAYRVGLYNDGYLGSESDLGTFANRELEIKWLEKQAMHTFYGGEVVANYAIGTPLNTAAYMSEEAFRTHTTYLNSEWNNSVIYAWGNEIYNGKDELYKGETGYTYIANHLGYRFVLRKSEVIDNIEDDEMLKIKLQIENVGFANLINNKQLTIVLEKDGKSYEIPTNIDATTWNSQEVSNINIVAPLPDNIDLGEWKIYLRISQCGDMATDNNYKCIQLANSNIWDEQLGANYIGKVVISESTEETEDSGDGEHENGEYESGEHENGGHENEENPNQDENDVIIPDNENNNTPDIESSDETVFQGILPNTGSIIEIIIVSLILLIIIFNAIIFVFKNKKISK